MAVYYVDADELDGIATATSNARNDLWWTIKPIDAVAWGVPWPGDTRGQWERARHIIDFELGWLDKDARALRDRANRVRVEAAVRALSEFFGTLAYVVHDISDLWKRSQRVVADGMTEIFVGFAELQTTTIRLSDGAAAELWGSILPKPPKGGTERLTFLVSASGTAVDLDLKRDSVVTVERYDDGSYRVIVQRSGELGISHGIGAYGYLQLDQAKVGVALHASAGIGGAGTTTETYRFDPGTDGDMTKMMLLLGLVGVPGGERTASSLIAASKKTSRSGSEVSTAAGVTALVPSGGFSPGHPMIGGDVEGKIAVGSGSETSQGGPTSGYVASSVEGSIQGDGRPLSVHAEYEIGNDFSARVVLDGNYQDMQNILSSQGILLPCPDSSSEFCRVTIELTDSPTSAMADSFQSKNVESLLGDVGDARHVRIFVETGTDAGVGAGVGGKVIGGVSLDALATVERSSSRLVYDRSL